jgi:hypothetical protein
MQASIAFGFLLFLRPEYGCVQAFYTLSRSTCLLTGNWNDETTMGASVHNDKAPTLTIHCARRIRRKQRHDDDFPQGSNDDENTQNLSAPKLLPATTTASSMIPSTSTAKNTKHSTAPAFLGSKFELQYTCNKCNTRNRHRVSRVACKCLHRVDKHMLLFSILFGHASKNTLSLWNTQFQLLPLPLRS